MRQMLALPHIAPLARYSETLRGMRPGWQFPEFDPLSGGVEADMLFLLEKPGPMAGDSNFISMCNDDPTADHALTFLREADIDYRRLAIWNVMPGWNGEIRFTVQEREWGFAQLGRLLDLLPAVRVVVLIGRQAQRATSFFEARSLSVVASAHPSMRVRNRYPDRWKAIPKEWHDAKRIADHSNC